MNFIRTHLLEIGLILFALFLLVQMPTLLSEYRELEQQRAILGPLQKHGVLK